MQNPFRHFNSSAEVIRLAVMMFIRYQSVSCVYDEASNRFELDSTDDQPNANLEIYTGPLADHLRLGRGADPMDQAQITGESLTSGNTMFTNNTTDGEALAQAIQNAVRAHDPNVQAFKDFTCAYSAAREFVLTSGSEVELMLAELTKQKSSQPERITLLLSTALEAIGGEAVDWDSVHGLSVGDRQYLTRQFAKHIGFDLIWLTSSCQSCAKGFDVQVRQSEMPVKPAGDFYPAQRLPLGGGEITLRVPTGADQAAIKDQADEERGAHALLARLVEGPPSFSIEALDDTECERLEQAIEDMVPEVSVEVVTHCPECSEENRLAVDPYLSTGLVGGELFDEIHALASHYHWSEAAILALPRARRKRYLSLIDRRRGMVGGLAPQDFTG